MRALTNPAGVKVAYTYTTEGEVAGFTDAAGNRSEYSYDLKNRLIEVRRQGNVRDRYTRDAAGNLVAKHAGDGRLLLQFEIGPGNLPIKRVLSSGDEHTFEYDDSGRLLLAATKKDVLEFAYDDLGNCVLDMRNGRGVENRFFKGRCPGESVFAEKYITRYKRGTEGSMTITDPGGKFHEIRRFMANGLIEQLPVIRSVRKLRNLTIWDGVISNTPSAGMVRSGNGATIGRERESYAAWKITCGGKYYTNMTQRTA